jgi:hypothetical protein
MTHISSHYCNHSNVFILTFIFTVFLPEGRAHEDREPSQEVMLFASMRTFVTFSLIFSFFYYSTISYVSHFLFLF